MSNQHRHRRILDLLVLWFFYVLFIALLIGGIWGWAEKVKWDLNQ